jgi:hypothetical protein
MITGIHLICPIFYELALFPSSGEWLPLCLQIFFFMLMATEFNSVPFEYLFSMLSTELPAKAHDLLVVCVLYQYSKDHRLHLSIAANIKARNNKSICNDNQFI